MLAIVPIFINIPFHAGFAKTDVFIKNLTKTALVDTVSQKLIAPHNRELVGTIARRGLLGKDADQEYKVKFSLDRDTSLLLTVHFSEARGLRVMVRDEKKQESETDWILIPSGNGSCTFGVGLNFVVKVFYYQQALLPDIEFEILQIAI